MTARRKAFATILAATAVSLGCAAWWSFTTAGKGTLDTGPADALIVFGSPAELHGEPSPMQIWRVREAVAEYRRGAATHVIFTGGAAANQFVEADVMAGEACRMGIPPAAIFTEGHSRTTAENIQNVSPIMQGHGWNSAELISSGDHLPRIAVLVRQAPFQWRLHAAPTPGRGFVSTTWAYTEESAAILLLRTVGSAAEPLIHGIAVCEHWVVFLPKWVIWKLRHHSAA